MTIHVAKSKQGTDAQNKAEQKKRLCLMCGRMFDSLGPGNRICKKCKSTAAWRSGLS